MYPHYLGEGQGTRRGLTCRPAPGEWRNRQTRRIQVPVSARTWGFNSPLAHAEAALGPERRPGRTGPREAPPMARRWPRRAARRGVRPAASRRARASAAATPPCPDSTRTPTPTTCSPSWPPRASTRPHCTRVRPFLGRWRDLGVDQARRDERRRCGVPRRAAWTVCGASRRCRSRARAVARRCRGPSRSRAGGARSRCARGRDRKHRRTRRGACAPSTRRGSAPRSNSIPAARARATGEIIVSIPARPRRPGSPAIRLPWKKRRRRRRREAGRREGGSPAHPVRSAVASPRARAATRRRWVPVARTVSASATSLTEARCTAS